MKNLVFVLNNNPIETIFKDETKKKAFFNSKMVLAFFTPLGREHREGSEYFSPDRIFRLSAIRDFSDQKNEGKSVILWLI